MLVFNSLEKTYTMKKHIITIVVAVIGGLLLISMVGKKMLTSSYKVSLATQIQVLSSSESSFSLLELDMAIKTNDPDIMLIDLRTKEEYEKSHLPNAVNVPIEMLFDSEFVEYIKGGQSKIKVLYATSEAEAYNALSILAMKGNGKFRVLNGGFPIAYSSIIKTNNPARFHYTDEQMKYNYKRLMPSGESSKSSTAEKITFQASVPRGGC
jgi:rhodanese-related sulfurtransferase